MRQSSRRGCLLISAITLVLAGTAHAYIPPVDFLLGKLTEQRSKMAYSRLRVGMRCSQGDSKEALEQVLYIKTPGLVRWEKGPDQVEICRAGTCWQKHASGQTTRLAGWSYLPFLYFAQVDYGSRHYLRLLRSLGVDTQVDTITRFHGALAVVLGAKHWQRDRPQFWMDKDRYLPLRLMVREGGGLVDIRWIDWGSRAGGNWFPEKLEIERDGKLVFQCVVEQVASSAAVTDSLFKL